MFTIHLKAILHILPKQVVELGEWGGGWGGGAKKEKGGKKQQQKSRVNMDWSQSLLQLPACAEVHVKVSII